MTADLQELLQRSTNSELLRIATAGSVDDGKSTLIGRLLHDSKSIYDDHLEAVGRDSKRLGREGPDLALLTDGLRAEREQGITIDVAYRYFSTPNRRFILADTPGHEQYTRNMATGASTADLTIVLIDARNGVTVQTRRHGFIAALLEIPHVVVAINKMDAVGWSKERYDEIRSEYEAFAMRQGLRNVVFIPMSALEGDNVVKPSKNMPWYKGAALLTYLEEVYVANSRNLVDFRFPVQYVNRPHQDFRGFCGTIASGVVRKGDEVVALPSRKRTRVASIVTMDGELESAHAPMSVTLTLEDELDISRGAMICHPGNLAQLSEEIDAMVVWMSETPMKSGSTYLVKHTTRLVRGTVERISYAINPKDMERTEQPQLELNSIARVEMKLLLPLAFDEYKKNRATGAFILIDPITNGTVAAGMILRAAHHRSALRSVPAPKDAARSTNVVRHHGLVTEAERLKVVGQFPRTLWMTGLSGSGKSTIGFALEKRLMDMGRLCFVLDGDNVRHGLCKDLGFGPDDRKENIRRVAEVARLMNEAGLTVIAAFISPFRADRAAAREIIGAACFREVFVDTPIDICEQRDPKGLYKRARAGEIPQFTGVDSPFEVPENPEIHIYTHDKSVSEIVDRLVGELRSY